MISYEQAKERLDAAGQLHVLKFWDLLDDARQKSLLAQIETLDWEGVARMRAELRSKGGPVTGAIEPAEVLSLADEARARARAEGEKALRAGQVGVLLVAGGQGTRLGYDGPKGCFEIGPLSRAPLFEVHARKVLAREKRYGRPVPFYIMTSEENDQPTRAFFSRHNHFGLSPDRVLFFKQGMWPALWDDGRVVMDRSDHIFMSPDGHGGLLRALKDNGMLDDMQKRGIQTVFYFQVDNPMVEIADPVFIGAHRLHHAEVSVKVCAKSDPEEKVGVVVKRGDGNAVVEYSELTREQMYATGPDGELRFRFGSVAIHVFSVDFLISESQRAMPLHVAHKKVPCCNDVGQTEKPEKPNAYKFEKFIFDVVPDARRVLNLEFKREDEFSPVKNATGTDSAETAQRDMIRKAARWLEAAGARVPRTNAGEPRFKVEIDPVFASDPEELKSRLQSGYEVRKDVCLK